MSNTGKEYTKPGTTSIPTRVKKKKVKKPFYKRWWFIVIAVFFGIGIIGNVLDPSGEKMENLNETSKQLEKDAEDITNSGSTKEKEPVAKEAIVVTADELFQELDSNALKASKTYEDQYVEVTGVLSNIDAQGDYISLGAIFPGFTFRSIHCSISDEHLDAVMELVDGQEVTVVGEMTGVGEVLGYRLKVEKFLTEPSKPIERQSTAGSDEKVETSDNVTEQKNEKETTSDSSSGATVAEKNAVATAKSYLSYSSFSREGLIRQLEFEGFTTEEATYGADNSGADWMKQAIDSAKSYIDYSAFSETGLINQLTFEGFTSEEAEYGAANCGADWMEQAVKSAKSYLDFSSYSRAGLIDQLEFEGFTTEQATYGVEQNGL